MPVVSKAILKRLECPVDEDAGYTNDRWTNRDLIPIPPNRRTYRIWSFAVSLTSRVSSCELIVSDLLVCIRLLHLGIHHWVVPLGLW